MLHAWNIYLQFSLNLKLCLYVNISYMEHIREWKQVHQFSWTTTLPQYHRSFVLCSLILLTCSCTPNITDPSSFKMSTKKKHVFFFEAHHRQSGCQTSLPRSIFSIKVSPRTDRDFRSFGQPMNHGKRHHSYH